MFGYNYINQFNAQPQQDDRIWVQNETSAEAYLVAPNGFVRLWDSNKPIFYEKRSDPSGRAMPMEAYEYKQIASNRGANDNDGINELSSKIDGLMRRIEALEEGQRDESNADDATIQPISESISRRSTKRSGEIDR